MSLSGVPNVTYKPVKPIDWPQDQLKVPNGFGAMKTIDFNNSRNIGQEGFSYVGQVTLAAGQSGGFIIPIAADADFWCTQVNCMMALASALQQSPKVQITDVRSGYQFGFPYLRLHNFIVEGAWSVNMTNSKVKANRLAATLPQPFCFVRNSGIKVDLISPAGGGTYFFAFNGWKEYADVSR
jgi:hypothetical protein